MSVYDVLVIRLDGTREEHIGVDLGTASYYLNSALWKPDTLSAKVTQRVGEHTENTTKGSPRRCCGSFTGEPHTHNCGSGKL